jgi:hypothetical protein
MLFRKQPEFLLRHLPGGRTIALQNRLRDLQVRRRGVHQLELAPIPQVPHEEESEHRHQCLRQQLGQYEIA